MGRLIDQYERDGYLVTISGGGDIPLRGWSYGANDAVAVGRAFVIAVQSIREAYEQTVPAWRTPEMIYPTIISHVYPVSGWPARMYATTEERPAIDAWVNGLIRQAQRLQLSEDAPSPLVTYTTTAAATELGISVARVRQLARAMGINAGTGHELRLTPDDIAAMRQRNTRRGPAPKPAT